MLLQQHLAFMPAAETGARRLTQPGTLSCAVCGTAWRSVRWADCPRGYYECRHIDGSYNNGAICVYDRDRERFERLENPGSHFDRKFFAIFGGGHCPVYYKDRELFTFLCHRCIGEHLFPLATDRDQDEFKERARRTCRLNDTEGYLWAECQMRMRNVACRGTPDDFEKLAWVKREIWKIQMELAKLAGVVF